MEREIEELSNNTRGKYKMNNNTTSNEIWKDINCHKAY